MEFKLDMKKDTVKNDKIVEHGANSAIRDKKEFNALEILKNVTSNENQTSECEETIERLAIKMEEEINDINTKYEATLVDNYWASNNHGTLKHCSFNAERQI